MTILRLTKSIDRSPSRLALLLVPLVFVCIGLLPNAQAVVPPPPGGYPNFTTAAGDSALSSLTSGLGNTGVGWFALGFNTTTSFNTGVGAGALDLNTADNNTAVGAAALLLNTTGTLNTATGVDALALNNTGSDNTANGAFALFNNTTGSGHTAIGFQALYNNTSDFPDFPNTATGFKALYSNTSGPSNTANGAYALFSNTTGTLNTANGGDTLYSNTEGHRNTATGFQSLLLNTTGYRNTATGYGALFNNTTGNFNTANGWSALANGDFNETQPNGSLNTAVGASAGWMLTGDNNIDIGNVGDPADSNTIRIGTVVESTDPFSPNLVHPAHTATYIAGISGTAVVGDMVVVDANGQLGTMSSSRRFKKEIRPMDKTSEAILAFKPVSFLYKSDSKSTPQFGLIAEEVAKVNPDLVVRDREGEIYSVRYEAVNAMLLNEFLKEHKAFLEEQRKVQKQEATITELKSTVAQQKNDFQATVAQLTARLDEQASQIQKVSAQLEASKPAPQVVNNP